MVSGWEDRPVSDGAAQGPVRAEREPPGSPPRDAARDGAPTSEPPGLPEPGSAGPAFALMALGRMVREDVEARLRPSGLALRHLSALGHLSRRPGLSYSELARRAGVTVQSMQATLVQLEERGAVERARPAGRGRAAELRVTPVGLELLGTAERSLHDAGEQVLALFPADQHGLVQGLLSQALIAALRRGRVSRGAGGPGENA